MSSVRSVPMRSGNSAPQVEQEYNRVALALAIFATLCVFVALWGLNGYFTARTVVAGGRLLALAFLTWGTGWLAHLVISLIERHLWRLRQHLRGGPFIVTAAVYGVVLLVGVADVFTSVIGVLDLAARAGFDVQAFSTRIVATVLAETIAILPEPVIIWLSVALYRVIKSR
jgi:hypothetical protein